MGLTQSWQRVTAAASAPEWPEAFKEDSSRHPRRTSTLWMILDALTVVGAATLATLLELHIGLFAGAKGFWHGTLIRGWSMGLLLAMLGGFICALIITSRRMHLYTPMQLNGFLQEQALTLQACAISGLLLTGALYVLHATDIPPTIVLLTLGLVVICLSVRRFVYRLSMYRRFDRGIGTRNVLIVGTGPEAHAIRHHVENIRHLGYSFKGFIELAGSHSRMVTDPSEIVGTVDTLFQRARKDFVDEIFIAGPCDPGIVPKICKEARIHGVDLRVVPDLYDGLAWDRPVEYIGQFPTIPLHSGRVPELALVMKRVLDVMISTFALVSLSPVLAAIAIAVKLDSSGPVFYRSERIGKKGRVFRCTKFRTMVIDAEKRREALMHMNERDGVLFKMSNDPRITRVGRILRKYSLDELPQFFNVLSGDMSVVGPRPPIATEVREYQLSHLRRLDVTPGITGLWQVQGRQDPSFDSYISLDLTYIENWSIWLDIRIILKTVGVVFQGTGS